MKSVTCCTVCQYDKGCGFDVDRKMNLSTIPRHKYQHNLFVVLGFLSMGELDLRTPLLTLSLCGYLATS
jgi:hypothetical protein